MDAEEVMEEIKKEMEEAHLEAKEVMEEIDWRRLKRRWRKPTWRPRR